MVPSPRRGRVCNGSGIVAMPQRTPDKPGIRFQIVEALLDIDNTFKQPIHLVAGRQIQGPEGRVAPGSDFRQDRGDRGGDVVGHVGRSRQRGAHVGGTAEVDSSQHGEPRIVPGTPRRNPRIAPA